MKKIKDKTKVRIVICGCAVAAAIVLFLIVRGMSGFFSSGTDTSAGLEYIRQEEAGSITAIEEKIALLETQDAQQAQDDQQAQDTQDNAEDQEGREASERSVKEKFTDSVVIGDSIVYGLQSYDTLNTSSVTAEIGLELSGVDKLLSKVKDLEPGMIFLSMGMSDVIATDGDVDKFISEYRNVLRQIRQEIPNAHIFVNTIFPAQDQAVKEEPALGKTEDYNKALEELCESENIGFIDNSEIVKEELYEEDGIHFKQEFYPIWATFMAEVADL